MKNKVSSIFWGLVLILLGGLFLAQSLGYFVSTSPVFWMAVFAGLGVLFLVTYFLNGVQHWGWLFPASIFGATALTMGLSDAGVANNFVALPILLSVALPFIVAFAFDMRRRWWALIPAWVMVMISLLVLFADRMPGELVGTLVLWSIALPFFVVYLVNRANHWALIPASILAVIGLIPLLSTLVGGIFMGAAVVLLIALPFLAAFLWSKRNWWALIPAGILGSVGVALLVQGSSFVQIQNDNLFNGIMFFGWAVTFGVLWLLRTSRPTDWAKYPAVVMGVIGLVLVTLGSSNQIIGPILVVCAGLFILVYNLLPKRAQ